MRGRADAEGFQAVVASDAVLLVDDQIALGDLGGLGDELVGALAAARGAADALTQEVLLADEAGLLADEAAFQAQGDDGGDGGGLLPGFDPGVALLDLEAVFAQQVGQAFAGAAGPGATTVRRPPPAQVAACSPSCWKALAPMVAPALVKT